MYVHVNCRERDSRRTRGKAKYDSHKSLNSQLETMKLHPTHSIIVNNQEEGIFFLIC